MSNRQTLPWLIKSPASGKTYECSEVLGEGGFGVAYRACTIDRRGSRGVSSVCVKVIEGSHKSTWIHEAYFGELLRGHYRVIQIADAFPFFLGGKSRRPIVYVLVSELAKHGSLADWLKRNSPRLREKRIKREAIGLLHALDRIHRGGAVHRDLTPFNILVCEGESLKLGDFGIARHGPRGRGVEAGTFNMGWVPSRVRLSEQRWWRERDDIYQMGQLLATLVQGEAVPITTTQVKLLKCSAELKVVIRRAIGEPGERYRDALEMIAALKEPGAAPTGGILSLRGKEVVFTGSLPISRAEAKRLAARAGARVSDSVTKRTDVLVRGQDSPVWIADKQGTKLIAALRISERGGVIRIINEVQFARLVGR